MIHESKTSCCSPILNLLKPVPSNDLICEASRPILSNLLCFVYFKVYLVVRIELTDLLDTTVTVWRL